MNFIKCCDHCDAIIPSSVLSVDSLQSAVLCHVHKKSNVHVAQLEFDLAADTSIRGYFLFLDERCGDFNE